MKADHLRSEFFFYPNFFYSTANNFNMEEFKQPSNDAFEQMNKQLDDGVYEQIKGFIYWKLTEEQESLVASLS